MNFTGRRQRPVLARRGARPRRPQELEVDHRQARLRLLLEPARRQRQLRALRRHQGLALVGHQLPPSAELHLPAPADDVREAGAAAELDADRAAWLRHRLEDRVLLRRRTPPRGAVEEELPPHRVLLRVPASLQM